MGRVGIWCHTSSLTAPAMPPLPTAIESTRAAGSTRSGKPDAKAIDCRRRAAKTLIDPPEHAGGMHSSDRTHSEETRTRKQHSDSGGGRSPTLPQKEPGSENPSDKNGTSSEQTRQNTPTIVPLTAR